MIIDIYHALSSLHYYQLASALTYQAQRQNIIKFNIFVSQSAHWDTIFQFHFLLEISDPFPFPNIYIVRREVFWRAALLFNEKKSLLAELCNCCIIFWSSTTFWFIHFGWNRCSERPQEDGWTLTQVAFHCCIIWRMCVLLLSLEFWTMKNYYVEQNSKLKQNMTLAT